MLCSVPARHVTDLHKFDGDVACAFVVPQPIEVQSVDLAESIRACW